MSMILFSYRVIKAEEAFEFELSEQTAWWFVLEMGITHEGKRISAFPNYY